MAVHLRSEWASVHRKGSRSPDHQPCDDLSILLQCLACCCAKHELLAIRTLCKQSPSYMLAAAANSDAAGVVVQCSNRCLRENFTLVERCLCHHSSYWRRGFFRRKNGNRAAAFWIGRGIRRMIKEELPTEVEHIIASFCNNPCMSWVSLQGRQLSKLNNLTFHWHRKFSQGSSGPWWAVHLARKILASSGAAVLKVLAGIRIRNERAVNLQGQDVTEEVCADAQPVQTAFELLHNAYTCMQAHPRIFGKPLEDAMAEDQALKDENREEEARLERLCQLGYYAAEAEHDARL
eukprot:TRINITY_DN49340_c0_g1_i1.p1 TRINITY_DN49340_c0_g1~~TRINITY_DN49340_c0_g1_i1.p1  ORF type:complete len:292 (+),score=36.96 TRINITY_DN49340_c0_g1_i1:109-984(+)